MLKSNIQTFVKIFWVFIVLQTSFSCSPFSENFVDVEKHPDLANQSWLSGQSCLAPCWQGLELGVSPREEAIHAAQNLAFVQNEHITENLNWVNFACKEPSDRTCISLGFEEETLSKVSLYINYQLTLEQVVEDVGAPDSFVSSYRNPEGPPCDIELFWINRQLNIDISYDKQDYASICESLFVGNPKFPRELLVHTITYLPLAEINTLISDYKKTGNMYRLWNGFEDKY